MNFSRSILGIAKWLVAPALFAGIGYYYLGPNIGRPNGDGKSTSSVDKKMEVAHSTPPVQSKLGEPDIEVTITKTAKGKRKRQAEPAVISEESNPKENRKKQKDSEKSSKKKTKSENKPKPPSEEMPPSPDMGEEDPASGGTTGG